MKYEIFEILKSILSNPKIFDFNTSEEFIVNQAIKIYREYEKKTEEIKNGN